MAALLTAVERTLPGSRMPVNRLRAQGCNVRGRRSGRGLDRDDDISMCLALFVPDRDIFARTERMSREAVAAFVVVDRGLVIVEHPTRVLGAARLVHQKADFIVLAFPKPAHAAMLTVGMPELRVDMA